MDPHSHPLLGDALPPLERLANGAVSDLESKRTPDCGDGAACMQRPFSGGHFYGSYSSPVRLSIVVFISLAVVYFLLRCSDLTKGRYRAVPLIRGLAAGDGRPCHKYEEDWGNGREEGFWIDGLEWTAGNSPAEEGPSGSTVWQSDTRRSSSMPLTPGIFGGLRPVAIGTEQASAADNALELTGGIEGNYAHRQHPQSQGTLHPCQQGLERGNGGVEHTTAEVRLQEGETLEMWKGRHLPQYAEMQLVSVFKRMMGAASACQSLLELLDRSQRLRLSCEVMRLLALELGAISLVREHLEPLRSNLGVAIVDLGLHALQRSSVLEDSGKDVWLIRELIALVLELKNPRPATEENVAVRYRKKMVSILQTASLAAGYCMGVVLGLLAYTQGRRSTPPPFLIEKRIDMLKALYATHSRQIARDASLRHFIVACQRRMKIYPILGPNHFRMSTHHLPPLKYMKGEIHQAVASAGGLLTTSGTPLTKYNIPVASQEHAYDYVHSPHGPGNGTHRNRQQLQKLASKVQAAATAEPQYLQATAPFVQPLYPRSAPSLIGNRTPQHHLPQRLPMPPLHHRFSSQVSGMHRQEPTMRVIPSQVSSSLTAQIGPLDGPTLPKPIYASGGGGGTSLPMPYSVWWEESMTPPQPHPQHTRPEITETTVPRGGHTYSSHRHYSSYDRRALRPVGGLPTVEQGAWQASGGASGGNYEAVRADTQQQQLEAEELEEEGGLFADMGGFPTVEESTWQASGGAYGRNSESVQADAQQQQLEAEELEEEEGMLADLLKGGLKIKDIFPNGKPPYK